jgi:hypothetical protein
MPRKNTIPESMNNKKINIFEYLVFFDYLLVILSILSLMVIYTASKITGDDFIIFLFSLALITTLLIIGLEERIKNHPVKTIEKFCRLNNFSFINKIQSSHMASKLPLHFLDGCSKFMISFHAAKKINKTDAELYFASHHLAMPKKYLKKPEFVNLDLLILELKNPNFDFSEITVVSDPLLQLLGLEKDKKYSTDHPAFNLKFTIAQNKFNFKKFISKLHIQALLDFNFPIGIVAKGKKIVFFIEKNSISNKNLEKLWQIIDYIGV